MPDRIRVLGIDVGGTFIDYVALDVGVPVRAHKVLNRPDALAEAILAGLAEIAPGGAREVVHGTTVATNAIIERRGATVALATTKGFADVIEIGRQDRPDLYSLESSRPPPLVSPAMRFEVNERIGADGEVISELTDAHLGDLATAIAEAKPDAVAVCLLFSFRHPDHERRVADALRARGITFVTTSTDVMPEYREYERTSTTVANAYLSPLLAGYLSEVSDALATSHSVDRFEVMQSNAGVLSAEEAARNGVRMLLSGPAGGVAGAFDLAQQHSTSRIITFDMGGTSTDVALCDGSIPTSVERDIAGIPVRLPMVDIETVGAGGGSIARLDSGGALRVGPESAGADPGPACFGRGMVPTVTDAQAVCGLLDVGSFLGGALSIDLSRANRVMKELARQMDVTTQKAADGVLDVANASIEQAIRRISIERGFDPRDFTLVAFGGAGPLHACAVAEGLGIDSIIIPPFPGVLSALGMAQAEAVRDFSQSVLGQTTSIDAVWKQLEEKASAALPGGATARTLDCRYRGQGYELEVSAEPADGLTDRFHAAHLRRFGFEDREREVEVVTARLRARRRRDVPSAMAAAGEGPRSPRKTTIRWAGRPWSCPVEERAQVAAGALIRGPALLVQADSAALLAPGWAARNAPDTTLLLHRER